MVDTENAYEHVNGLYERVKHVPRVIALKMEPVLLGAKEYHQKVIYLAAELWTWKGEE